MTQYEMEDLLRRVSATVRSVITEELSVYQRLMLDEIRSMRIVETQKDKASLSEKVEPDVKQEDEVLMPSNEPEKTGDSCITDEDIAFADMLDAMMLG